MDRERLKEVHKTDMTESRVNEDFVDWMKNKGPTWLLVVLVAFTAYLTLVRWRSSQDTKHIQAWRALSEAEQSQFPASLQSVADDYGRVDSIGVVARIHAAQLLLDAVLTGRSPGAIDADAPPMNEQEREQNLTRADRLYQEVLDTDDGSRRMTIHAVNALNGRAAIAEARGDLEAAKRHYLAAATRVDAMYPQLAEQSRLRAEGEQIPLGITLPAEDDVLTPADPGANLRPARIEPSLNNLLLPIP